MVNEATTTVPKASSDAAATTTVPKASSDAAVTTTVPKASSDAAATTTVPKASSDAAATSGATKNKLDAALEAYLKIQKQVGEGNVKDFLEAATVEGSLLKGDTKKDDEENKKSVAAKAAEKREEMMKSYDEKFRDTSGMDLKLPTRPPGFEAKYLTENWELKSIATVDNPTSLKPAAWAEIFSTNKSFHGFLVSTDGIFSRARYAAFEGKLQGTATEYMPQFEVCDDSSITIKETSSQFEASMADNSFSSNAIRASISGGIGKFGFAASGGFNNESQSGHSHGDFQDRKEYRACYTFPRARIFLDEANLKITTECAKDIADIRRATDQIDASRPDPILVTNAQKMVQAFTTKYGNVFATTFLVGGQLTASRYADAVAGTDDTTKRDAMKWSAAVSIDCSFGGLSVSGGRERSSNETTHTSESRSSAGLAWAARGGNTLLAASPAAWANSVASFQTWRSMEQDKIWSLPYILTRILSTIPADASLNPANKPDVRTLFTTIENYTVGQVSIAKALSPPVFSGRFKLEAVDGKYVKWDGDKLQISQERNPWDATVFCAVNADVSDPQPMLKLTTLLAEWPLFLPTRHSGTSFEKKESGVPGIWVSDDGFIHREVYRKQVPGTTQEFQDDTPLDVRRTCRWSLGKAGDVHNDGSSKWSPSPIKSLAEGDRVKLYCHSYFSGGYRSTKAPPFFAPSVRYNSGDPQRFLRVPKVTNKTLHNVGLITGMGDSEFWKRDGALRDFFAKEETGNNSLWELVHTYDQLPTSVTSDSALQIVDTMCELCGLSENALWEKYKDCLNKMGSIHLTQDLTASLVQCALSKCINEWSKSTGCSEELIFTIRYV